MKAFNELTERGQKARLTKYDKERQAQSEKYGVKIENALFRIVRPAKITNLHASEKVSDGAMLASIRVVTNDPETKKPVFSTATAYIQKNQTGLLDYYKSLAKGQLVSMDFVRNENKTLRVWQMMSRERKNAKA